MFYCRFDFDLILFLHVFVTIEHIPVVANHTYQILHNYNGFGPGTIARLVNPDLTITVVVTVRPNERVFDL